MTQELLKFDTLPAVLEQNKALTGRAKLAVEQGLKELTQIDLKSADIATIDRLELKAKELWERTEKALSLNKERRMPFTAKMDEVRKLFTTDEKTLSELIFELKSVISSFGKERVNRKNYQEEVRMLETNKALAKVDLKGLVVERINTAYIDMLHDYKNRIKSKFNELTGDELKKYKDTLSTLKVKFNIPKYEIPKNEYLNVEEQKIIMSSVENEISQYLKPSFEDYIKDYIADLLNGNDTDNNEAEEKLNIEIEKEERLKKVEEDKMNVLFNNSSEATENVELGKGTSVANEYDLTSHNDYIEIIKFWVTKDLPNLTIEEIKKKLSFMVTAANRWLNKGEVIKGLKTKDVIKIRKTKE